MEKREESESKPPDLFLPPVKLNREIFFQEKKRVWPERKCLIDSLPPRFFLRLNKFGFIREVGGNGYFFFSPGHPTSRIFYSISYVTREGKRINSPIYPGKEL